MSTFQEVGFRLNAVETRVRHIEQRIYQPPTPPPPGSNPGILEMNCQLNDLKKEVNQKQSEITVLRAKLEDAHNVYLRQEQDIRYLRFLNSRQADDYQRHTAEITTLKKQLADAPTYEGIMATLKNQRHVIKLQADNCCEQAATIRDLKDKLFKAIFQKESVSAAANAIEANGAELTATIEELTATIQDLKDRLKHALYQRDTFKTMAADSRQAVVNIEKQLTEVQQQSTKQVQEIRDLNKKLEYEISDEWAKGQAKLKVLKDKIKKIEVLNSRWVAEISYDRYDANGYSFRNHIEAVLDGRELPWYGPKVGGL